MKLQELLEAMQSISPLPEDDKCSDELLDRYHDLLMTAGTFNDPVLIKLILQSIGYGHGFGVYHTAEHILEKYPSDDLIPVLLEGLQDSNAGTRMWSAHTLGYFHNPDHIPYLLPLLEDDKELVRSYGAGALLRFVENYPEVKARLLQLKDDPFREVRATVSRV